MAILGAEVVALPMVLNIRGRSVWVDVHSTYNIFDSSHVFLLFWFVFLYVNDWLILDP